MELTEQVEVTVEKIDFHGWPALKIQNRQVEAVVVPAIGRVMAFGRVGGPSGPIWNHPRIGADLAPDENGWINFGGEKAWPAPQSRWEAIAGRGWPPPRTFDQMPYAASGRGLGFDIELVSQVDPAYGVRVRRRISLPPARESMTIETRYEKVEGPPVSIGVWTIAQLAAPVRLFARLASAPAIAGGFVKRMEAAPKELAVDGRLLSLGRDPAAKTMIGLSADALLWLGDGPGLLVERVAETGGGAGDWPDGAEAQIYTSSDDAEPYVELELFGRVRELRPGDSSALTVRYTIVTPTTHDLAAEAKRAFNMPRS
jgi:hypothetical protein